MDYDFEIDEAPSTFSWKAAALWFMLGAVTASGIIFGVIMWQALQGMLKQPYAVWQAAEMVIEYMEKRQNRWPTSWKDLEETHGGEYSHTNMSFELIKELVVIDWNADPKQLAKAILPDDDQPPFRVIWLRNGRTSYVTGSEPNRLIFDYLKLGKFRPR